MSVEAWTTLAVVLAVFLALLRNLAAPDLLFVGASALLAALGIITSQEAVAGFANPGMLAVAALFIVAAALLETGILDYLGQQVLGRSGTPRHALARLAVVVIPLSAFLNNTPVVAMFVPVVIDWARRRNVSASKVLIPLSYFAILGGTCTLIGTSTTLVVNGLMLESDMPGMYLFEIAWIGIPYTLIGLLFLQTIGIRLLPERRELLEQLGASPREYIAEMMVETHCRLGGETVEESGLRGLHGLFLIEINRHGDIIAPVRPDQTIEVGDRLIFTGIVSSIVELEKIHGLVPAMDPNYEISPKQQRGRRLWEAVISESSPLVGQTLREADFRATYGAAVVAAHRGGKRVNRKLGDIVLRGGDTLLLQAARHFRRAFRNDPAFYLISDVSEWRPLRRDRAWIACVVFALLVVAMFTGFLATEVAAMLAAVAMIATRCISTGDARRSIEWQVLLTIAGSFGVGAALQNSGAATAIASLLVDATKPYGPVAALAAMYLLGSILTELITNNAAAILLFPFCLETARLYDADARPFLMALVLSASASFMTPIGYQTNMMVYGPGGYRFIDFFRVGAPLNFLLWITATALLPVIWPF
jgi:di/tricarboxylate transporter